MSDKLSGLLCLWEKHVHRQRRKIPERARKTYRVSTMGTQPSRKLVGPARDLGIQSTSGHTAEVAPRAWQGAPGRLRFFSNGDSRREPEDGGSAHFVRKT